ncbi:MAG: hypothetical protein LIO96_05755 [Lachnospiraceae bacterium]|nr:hypothetical protein [Lachnospiraceae bacterium]
MTKQQLSDKWAICFDKITDRLRKYAYVKLVFYEKKAFTHFKSLRKEYGAEHAYADFYYFRLDFDAREMVNELLSPEEICYLELICPLPGEEEEAIIFPLDEKLLKIIVRLNASEILFSTIYFTASDRCERMRTTWWGNYGKEYICFKDR